MDSGEIRKGIRRVKYRGRRMDRINIINWILANGGSARGYDHPPSLLQLVTDAGRVNVFPRDYVVHRGGGEFAKEGS